MQAVILRMLDLMIMMMLNVTMIVMMVMKIVVMMIVVMMMIVVLEIVAMMELWCGLQLQWCKQSKAREAARCNPTLPNFNFIITTIIISFCCTKL